MADSDKVQVQLGTDASQGTAGMKDAESKIADSLNAINDSLKKFGEQNAAVVNQAVKNNNDLMKSFETMKGTMTGGYGQLVSIIERVKGGIAMAGTALAGGLIGKESVEAMLHMEQTVRDLEIVFGMSAEGATKMAVSLKLAGIEASQFEQMGMRILMRLRQQSGEFERLGVKVKDTSTGGFLPMEQILQNVYKRMQDFRAGADQDMFVLTAIGRNAKDFAGEMQRLNAVQEETTNVMQKFGISMGPEEQAKIEQYRIKVNAFKVGLEAIGEKIGALLLPRLMGMAEWMGSVGPAAAEVIVNALKIFLSVITYLGIGVVQVGLALRTFATILMDVYSMLHDIDVAMSHFDFSGAVAAAKKGWDRLKTDAKQGVDDIVGAYRKGMEAIDKLWADEQAKQSGGRSSSLPGSGPEKFIPKPKGNEASTWLSVQRDALRQMLEENGNFFRDTTREELAFWEERLAIAQTKGKSYEKIVREINSIIYNEKKKLAHEALALEQEDYKARLDAAKYNKDEQLKIVADQVAYIGSLFGLESLQYKRMLDEEIKMRQAWAEKEAAMVRDAEKHKIDMGQIEIEAERQTLDQAVALRQISDDQKYAMEVAFENRLYALRLKGLQDELATLHIGTLAYQQKIEEIEKLEAAHQIQLTRISNQAELERKQTQLTAIQDVQNAFATMLGDIATGTKSIKQALTDMIKSVTNELTRLAAQDIAKKLFGPGTSGGGILDKIFGGIFGKGSVGTPPTFPEDTAATAAHTAAVQTDTTTLTEQVVQTNLVTTSLQMLSTAAQAAAASLQTVGASSGMGGGIGDLFSGGGGSSMFELPFFDVGTPYVPQDTLAVVHKGEAIVPAQYNKARLAGRGGFVNNNQFVISGPIDSRTQDQINASAARGVQRAAARIL